MGTIYGETIWKRGTAWAKLWRHENARPPLPFPSKFAALPRWAFWQRGGVVLAPMSLSLPHPHPMQEGLQASSLLTLLHLLSSYGPCLGDHAASFPWAQGAKNLRTLVASFWRGHPKGTRCWSSPAPAPHTQHAQTPRLPGSSASVNPEILSGA